jgi:hypothetical protein
MGLLLPSDALFVGSLPLAALTLPPRFIQR